MAPRKEDETLFGHKKAGENPHKRPLHVLFTHWLVKQRVTQTHHDFWDTRCQLCLTEKTLPAEYKTQKSGLRTKICPQHAVGQYVLGLPLTGKTQTLPQRAWAMES